MDQWEPSKQVEWTRVAILTVLQGKWPNMALTGKYYPHNNKIRIKRQHSSIKREHNIDQGRAAQNLYNKKETHLSKTWKLLVDLHLLAIHLVLEAHSQRNQEWEAHLLLFRIKLATLLLSCNHKESQILLERSSLRASEIRTWTPQLTIRLSVGRVKSLQLWVQVNWITS